MNSRPKQLIALLICLLTATFSAFGKDFVENNTNFALELYQKLKNDTENLFFSPYSISTALSMTYAGARGETAVEMAKTLHFSTPQADIPPAFHKLQTHLNAIEREGNIQLSVANSLWPQEGYPFLNQYLELIEKYYGEEITPLNFATATEEARQTINRWVESKTNGKIKDLIGRNVLTHLTRMVLVNAIYFKGDWADEFDEKQTETADFYLFDGKTADISLMSTENEFKYDENDEFQVLSLPYKGKELSMLIFLPKKGRFSDFEAEMTLENLQKWRSNLTEQDIRVFLPKFKLTWGTKSLKEALIALGMPAAFDEGKTPADFSGMDGTKDLYIQDVLHKAFIEVNEQGTEAAAATAVVIGLKSLPPPVPVFRADHPFVFLIQENETGSILFMGRVMNPGR